MEFLCVTQPSSPSNGINETLRNDFINPNPSNPKFGDLHVYNYEADGWNPYSYPQNARFVSEYGMTMKQ